MINKKVVFIIGFVFLSPSLWPVAANKSPEKIAQESLDLLYYDRAVQYFDTVLEKKPKKRGLHAEQAFAYFRLGQPEQAVDLLKKELTLFPNNLDANILLSYVLFENNEMEAAVQACRDFENRERRTKKIKGPNAGLPAFILGLYDKNNNRFMKAERYFNQALKREYDSLACHIQLIDVEIERGNLGKALIMAQDVLNDAEPQPEILFMMGYINALMDEWDMAAFCFEAVLIRRPFMNEASKNLAKIYFLQSRIDKARETLRLTHILNPSDKETMTLLENPEKINISNYMAEKPKLKYVYEFHMKLKNAVQTVHQIALTQIKSGYLQAAADRLRRFSELYDLSPGINYNLGQLYNTLGKPEKALQYAWKARELEKDYMEAYDLVGNIFYKLGDYDRSVSAYKSAIRLNSEDPMTHYNLGCVYYALGDLAQAETHWKKAVSLEKDSPSRGETETATASFDVSLIITNRTASFESYKSLGDLYIRTGRKEAARQSFLNAIRLKPNEPESYYQAGKLSLELQDKSEATKYFEKYLYLGGTKEEEVRKLLQMLSLNYS